MSVDNRIVKLQFDNKQFEQGVSQSMSTLDKLEEKLQFKKSAKGFQTLQNAADSVGFDRLVAGIESINKKLSATGVLAAKFVNNIADSIASGVKKIEQASLGQIKSGGWARAMKIENAKFAVQGLKGDWDELYKAIDYSVSGTAYGVDAAAKAASTLMASGVDYMKVIDTKNGQQLTQMHKSLRAISGVAAQTNSEFDDIAHIFTTVAGNGRLMADQLNQLSGRGMNAAAILGEQLGMSEAAVREATSKGQIDFKTFADAMDSAFGDHAKDANKTFTGSLSNMKAALSRFGAVFATPIIQKTNTFFIALTGQINKMKKAIADTVENGKVLEEHLESHFAKMWENLITLGSTLVKSIDLTWFEKIADSADSFVKRLSDAFEIMNAFASTFSTDTNKTAKKVYDTTSITEGELDVVEKIIKGEFGNGAKRKKELEQYLKANEMNYDPEKLQAYVNVLAKVNYIFEKAGIKKVKEAGAESEKYNRKQESVQKTFINIYSTIHNFNAALSKLKDNLGEYFDSITAPFGGIIGIAEKVTGVISDLVLGFDLLIDAIKPASDVLYGFYDVGRALSDTFDLIVGGIKTAIQWVSTFIASVIEGWKQSGMLTDTLINIANTIRNVTTILKNLATSAGRIFKAIATAFFRVFNPAKASGLLSRFTGGLADISEKFLISEEATEVLTDVLTGLFTVLDGVITKISEVVIKITEFIGGLGKTDEVVESVASDTEVIGEEAEETGNKLDKLTEIITKVKDFFKKFGEGAKELYERLKENEGIKKLGDSLTNFIGIFKKDATDRINEFKNGVGELSNGETKELTIEDVANAIGNFANNIAEFIDKLPEYITKLENFFKKVKDAIDNFFSTLKKTEEENPAKSFLEKVKETAAGIGTDIKLTFKNIVDGIKKVLDKISWSDVLGSAFVIGAITFLFKMTSLAESIRNVFTGIDGVIKAVGTIANNAANVIMRIGKAFQNVSLAILIGTIAASILAIVAAIYILTTIDEDKMIDAVSTVIIIFGAIVILIKAITKVIDSWANKIDKKNQRPFLKMATAFISLGAVVWILCKALDVITDSLGKMSELLDKYTDNGLLEGAVSGIITILAVLLGITAVLLIAGSIVAKKMEKGSEFAKNLIFLVGAMATAMLAIGASVWLISDAITKVLSVSDKGLDAIGDIVKLLAVLLGGMVLIIVFAQSLKPEQLVTVGVLLLEVVVAMMIIFAGIYVLALAMTGTTALGKVTGIEDQIAKAVMLVCAIMLVLAVSIAIISAGIKSVVKYGDRSESSAKLLTKVMLGVVAIMAVVMICTVLIAKQMSGMTDNQLLALDTGLLMVTLILLALKNVLIGISEVFKSFGNANQLDKAANVILSIGGMMILMLAGIALIVAAFSLGNLDSGQIISMAVVIAIAIGGLIAILSMMGKLAKSGDVDAEKMQDISKSLLLASVAFVILGVAVAIMAVSLKNIQGIADQFVGMLFMCVVIIAGIGLAVKLMSQIPDFADNMKALALGMIAFGGMVILIAAAAAILDTIGPDGMQRMIVTVLGLAALLVILSAIFGGSETLGKGLSLVGGFLKAIAIAMLLFGAALVVAAAGIGLMASVLPDFAEAFAKVCQVISEHSGVVFGIGLLIIAILIVVAITILKTMPIIDKIVTAVTNALNIIWDIIKSVGKKAADGISNFHKNKKLSAGVKATIVTLITALASSLVESGPEVLQKIGDFLWIIIDWIISVIPKLCDKLVEILLELIFGILDGLTKHINEIEAAIKSIAIILGAIVMKVIADVVADLGEVTLGWIPGFTKKMDKVRAWGDNLVKDAKLKTEELRKQAKRRDELIASGKDITADDIGSTGIWGYNDLDRAVQEAKEATEVKQSLEEAKKTREDAYKAYAKNKDEGIDWNKTFLYGEEFDPNDYATEELKRMSKRGMIFTDEMNRWYKVREGSADIIKKNHNAVNDYKYYYSEIANETKSGMDKVTDVIKDKAGDLIPEEIKDPSKLMGDAMGNMGDAFNPEAITKNMDMSAMPDAITANMGSNMPKIDTSSMVDKKEAAETGQETGKLIMYNTGQSARKEAGETGSAAADSFSDPYANELVANSDQYDEAGKTVAQTTADGVGSKESQDKMREAAEILSYVGADQLQNYGLYKWTSAGGNIVSALRYHLDKFADGPLTDPNSARALMDRIYHAMNDQFVGPTCWDSHSPSRRMLTVGEQLMQGLTNGIYDEETGAIKSMTDVYNSMVGVFSNPLDYVSKIASGEYQYDPSIRPVLDTSLVARGAYGINSMFDNQNVTLNGLSGSIAADIGRLDNSNADIIAELRLLRGDMTAMGEQISNMQVVMDTGRLVGAISNEMDGALGSRSSYISRGKGN